MRVVNEDVLRLISNALYKELDVKDIKVEFNYTLDCKSNEPKFKESLVLPESKIIEEIIFILTLYKYQLGQTDITKNLNVCVTYKYGDNTLPYVIFLTI